MVHSIYQRQVGKRGQGGVACLIQEHMVEKVSLHKVDKYKRYMRLKIELGKCLVFLAGCHIPHHKSPFYSKHGVDPSDAFEALCLDVAELIEKGQVIVMGDLNARIGHLQFQPITHDKMDKESVIEVDTMWQRTSEDDTINTQGRALMPVLN